MNVTPQDPDGPDPHSVPDENGQTDYQKWGSMGGQARWYGK